MCDLETSRIGAPYIYYISNLRVKVRFTNIENLKENSYTPITDDFLIWSGLIIYRKCVADYSLLRI